MNNSITDNETQQANRIIAFEVINERLGVDPTEANILFLANCISDLEKSTRNTDNAGDAIW